MAGFPQGIYLPLLPSARQATTGGFEQARLAGRSSFSRPARIWAWPLPVPLLAAFIPLILLAALVLLAAVPGAFAAGEGRAPADAVQNPPPLWGTSFPSDQLIDPKGRWPSSGYTDFEERELLSLDGIDPRLQPVCIRWTNKCIECERRFIDGKPGPARCRVSGWLAEGETTCKPVNTRCLSLDVVKAYEEVCRTWSNRRQDCGNPNRMCLNRAVAGPPWLFEVKCNFHDRRG